MKTKEIAAKDIVCSVGVCAIKGETGEKVNETNNENLKKKNWIDGSPFLLLD
jgi:coenzyme F420-reducing hydrogenase gamma subunit